MRWRAALDWFLAFVGLGPWHFVDHVDGGVPNLSLVAPNLWRMGQPADFGAWGHVAAKIAARGRPVVVIKLNDEVEGDDTPAETRLGWRVVRIPLPPEDDKPWTVLEKPRAEDVVRIIDTITVARATGMVVIVHCTHGRDRTSLVIAIARVKLFGWTKQQAWDEMIEHGFRWELPDLDAYWIEDVN